MGSEMCIRDRILLEAKTGVEREKGQLVASEAGLKSQVEQLQSSVTQLQHELQESHRELEATRRGEWPMVCFLVLKLHACDAYTST